MQDVGKTVPLATVEQKLSEFLTKLQSAQKSEAGVRVTDRVRMAGDALTAGLSDAKVKVAALLVDGTTLRKPSELAHAIAQCLPDPFPAANYGGLVDMSPTDVPVAQPQSASEALARQFDKTIDGVLIKFGVAAPARDAIKKAAADALTAGAVAALDKAMSESKIAPDAQKALHSAFEATLKLKDSGPPMDRQQGGAGSPDAPPTPPPSAAPSPPHAPGEQIFKGPSVNTPDTPPVKSKPPASPPSSP